VVVAHEIIEKSKEFAMEELDRTSSYPPPVDRLLTYGEADVVEADDWPNYLELGLGPEHIPDLIRMATDEKLNKADPDSLESWAPIHAWRALGQLRAEAAIEPLLALFDKLEDSEWVAEELPEVLGMIGPAALPALSAYMADRSLDILPTDKSGDSSSREEAFLLRRGLPDVAFTAPGLTASPQADTASPAANTLFAAL
jgi:hypothetical protein